MTVLPPGPTVVVTPTVVVVALVDVAAMVVPVGSGPPSLGGRVAVEVLGRELGGAEVAAVEVLVVTPDFSASSVT